MTVRNISLWGDSIGRGVIYDEARGRYMILKENCANLLSGKLNCKIENHAIMGATAQEGMKRMTDAFLKKDGIAVLEFGGNDCDMPWKEISLSPKGEHRPRATVEEFEEALTQLVRRVQNAEMKAVLVTPPPLDAERYFAWVSRGLNADAILDFLGDVQHIYRWQERYAAAVRDVAARNSCRLLDIRDAFLDVRCISDYYCVDGIHPNAKGHELLARTAEKKLALAL